MLAQNIRLQPDEMLSSWLDEIKKINMLDNQSIFRIMTGREGTIRMHGRSYPSELERLCGGIRRNGRTEEDIPDIVRDNTLFFIELPFLKASEQAQLLEFILRGSSIRTLTNRPSQNNKDKKSQMICPVCAEEDRKRCGRAYVHVPHQVPGVAACYRHGCRLIPAELFPPEEEPGTAEDTEVRIARFYYDIYTDPVCTDDRIRSLAVGSALEKQGETIGSFARKNKELIKCKESVKSWYSLTEASKRRFLAAVFGYSAEGFRKAAEESSDTDEKADGLKEISGRFDLLSPYGPVMYLECRQCGTKFYTHPEMISLGAGCPVCDSTLPEKTVIDRYVRHHGDGEYEVKTGTGARIRIIHRPCGTETRALLSYFIFRNGDCPVCAGKRRIGEVRTNSDGQKMTIIGYGGCLDVQVRFDDGTVVSHRTYQQFRRGTIENPNNNFKARRIGLEGVSVTGRKMKVAAYRGAENIDIRFEDGTVVKDRRFSNFISGMVLHPCDLAGNRTGVPVIKGTRIYDPSVRIGEKGLANNGQVAEIVRYRTARDMDVRFEDGTEVCGITYSHFKQGRVGKPSRPGRRTPKKSSPGNVSLRRRQEREGEKRVNRYGEEMKIIRYGSSTDIDVQFEGGTVVRHRTYADFLNDNIKNPNRGRKVLEKKWRKQIRTARNGMKMEVIACRKHDDADVRFEDGTVVEHISLKHFQDGSIRHPGLERLRFKVLRVGETSQAKNGQMMTVIAYRGARDIDIRFEDGTVVKNKSYDKFRKGTIRHPNLPHRRREPARLTDHKGENGTASDGSLIKISAFREYDDIDVMFEDGTVSKHRQYIQFKRGEIRNPNAPHGLSKRKSRLGETRVMKNSLSAEIIAYRNNKDIDVRFENGIVRKHMCYSNFMRGDISDKTQ